MYDVATFAEYLLARADKRNIEMNLTKLHKLTYAVYGLYYALYNTQILNDTPRAWPYGPAFSAIQNDVNIDTILNLDTISFEMFVKDTKLNEVIDTILTKLGNWTASELVTWTHGNTLLLGIN